MTKTHGESAQPDTSQDSWLRTPESSSWERPTLQSTADQDLIDEDPEEDEELEDDDEDDDDEDEDEDDEDDDEE